MTDLRQLLIDAIRAEKPYMGPTEAGKIADRILAALKDEGLTIMTAISAEMAEAMEAEIKKQTGPYDDKPT